MDALVCGQVIAERYGSNGQGILVIEGDADAFPALVGQRPDVNVGSESVPAQNLRADVGQLVGGIRDVDAQHAAVLFPTSVVLVRSKHEQLLLRFIPVRADALENAGPIMQRVSKDAY